MPGGAAVAATAPRPVFTSSGTRGDKEFAVRRRENVTGVGRIATEGFYGDVAGGRRDLGGITCLEAKKGGQSSMDREFA